MNPTFLREGEEYQRNNPKYIKSRLNYWKLC